MRFLPCLAIGAAVALAVTAQGCADRACLEWQVDAEGPCPKQDAARDFFGDCSDVERVDSGPTFLADEGGLCCYDVKHVPEGHPIPCRDSTTPNTPSGTSTGSETPTTSTEPSTTPTTTTPTTTTPTATETTSGGGGGMPSCETCDDVLVSGNGGNVCSGHATSALTQLVTCGCGASCSGACHDFCAIGAAPDGGCSSCLGSSCGAELTSCEGH